MRHGQTEHNPGSLQANLFSVILSAQTIQEKTFDFCSGKNKVKGEA